MAKKSAVARNLKREKLIKKHAAKRAELKAVLHNRELSPEERFQAAMKLNKLPKNACPIRAHNRCELTGRPHAFYRKFKISRIALRDLASQGQIPGVVKSSW
ncbi:30S ribosomal protein S14 [Aestuariispira insulae]|uniref:Small ribosomal subunit protein uS14 n=1 Tax=Aestuariispira insulae TaxID=1461337 RepID=A0A3D9HWD1_9PROT|nr:30S ribosomal protein S14 [Aestuariispira insulae]RED53719.1 SSU ribosomal protein S14P [Aestuariispira insulae]